MTTEVSNQVLVAATMSDEGINGKRKLATSISGADLKSQPASKTLSHSVSITGFEDLPTTSVAQQKIKDQIPSSAINLCSASFGAKVLFATDEWFAKADNLLKDTEPEFDEDAYCEQGKVMDGWESRRRREEGHDWCLIQLGIPYWTSEAPLSSSTPKPKMQLIGIELDTAHFTGNQTPQVSIEMASLGSKDCISTVKKLPNGVERLLAGGRQGTGHTPQEVKQAQDAIASLPFNEVLGRTPLNPGFESTRYHYFPLDQQKEPIILSADGKTSTWVKLNYFPDGGVARMRFWASKIPEIEKDDESEPTTKKPKTSDDTESTPLSLYMPITTGSTCTVVRHGGAEELPSQTAASTLVEISSDQNGGKGIACSNKHYGEPWRLIQSTLGKGMWDGWETARHSHRPSVIQLDPATKLMDTPLNDWCVLKLGKPSNGGDTGIQKIILDTSHFLGNYPESVYLEGCFCETSEGDDEDYWKSSASESVKWFPLVSRTRMSPNAEHVFEASKNQLESTKEKVTHLRLSTYPDGGVSRVRVYA